MKVVLDASALLAVLLREPGAEKVTPLLLGSKICSVNLTEVGTRLVNVGDKPETLLTQIHELGVEIVPFDQTLATVAIRLRDGTRSAGLSLGDRACIALAMREQAVAVTTDRAWARLEFGCEIELIR